MGIDQLSPSVKGYRLKVLNREVTFKPGQWVDVTIPDIDTVGGFSMCSTPLALRTKGILELAVKQSDHPPAQWMHGDVSRSHRLFDPFLSVTQTCVSLLYFRHIRMYIQYSTAYMCIHAKCRIVAHGRATYAVKSYTYSISFFS